MPSSAAPVGYPVRQDGGENGAKAAAEGSTTPQPFDQHRILTQEEKIEFRDEQGNILNEEQIAALDGKVSFKTRYETRTRLVDAQGNELLNEVVAGGDGADEQVLQQQQRPLQGVAPPHPDVDGRNPETVGESAAMASDKPPTVGVDRDLAKEKSVESAESAEKGAPRPASDGNQATR